MGIKNGGGRNTAPYSSKDKVKMKTVLDYDVQGGRSRERLKLLIEDELDFYEETRDE